MACLLALVSSTAGANAGTGILNQGFACGTGSSLSVTLSAPIDAGDVVEVWLTGTSAGVTATVSDSAGSTNLMGISCVGGMCAGSLGLYPDGGAQTFTATATGAFTNAEFDVLVFDSSTVMGTGVVSQSAMSLGLFPLTVQAGDIVAGSVTANAPVTSVSPYSLANTCITSVFFSSARLDAGSATGTVIADGGTVYMLAWNAITTSAASSPDAGADAGAADAGARDGGAADGGFADGGIADAGVADGGQMADAGGAQDAGAQMDGGSKSPLPVANYTVGCDCQVAASPLGLLVAWAALGRRRRPRALNIAQR